MCLSLSEIGHVLCCLGMFIKDFEEKKTQLVSQILVSDDIITMICKATNDNSTLLKITAQSQARWLSIQIA